MAKKINLSGVKEFLFNHGEKVALGACALLGIWGVFSAAGAGRDSNGKPYTALFDETQKRINSGINMPFVPDSKGDVVIVTKGWPDLKSTHPQTQLIALADINNDKRQRPKV